MSKLNLTASVTYEGVAEPRVLIVTLDETMVGLMKATPSLWTAFIATVADRAFQVLNSPDPAPDVVVPPETPAP